MVRSIAYKRAIQASATLANPGVFCTLAISKNLRRQWTQQPTSITRPPRYSAAAVGVGLQIALIAGQEGRRMNRLARFGKFEQDRLWMMVSVVSTICASV